MITALALASAAAPPAYPAGEVLRALQSVCFSRKEGADGETYQDMIDSWTVTAQKNGWSLLSPYTRDRSNLDASALGRIAALNHLLFGGYALTNAHSHLRTDYLGGQVFRKTVAGRTLYLSVFGAGGADSGMVECRVHDLLGDGITKNPITPRVIEQVFGARPKRRQGPFRGSRYDWQTGQGANLQHGSLAVHFGFDGWKASPSYPYRKVEIPDPHAPYGLTLVAAQYDEAIIVAGKTRQ